MDKSLLDAFCVSYVVEGGTEKFKQNSSFLLVLVLDVPVNNFSVMSGHIFLG